eukprot:2030888-Rhodomonas_salina.1
MRSWFHHTRHQYRTLHGQVVPALVPPYFTRRSRIRDGHTGHRAAYAAAVPDIASATSNTVPSIYAMTVPDSAVRTCSLRIADACPMPSDPI